MRLLKNVILLSMTVIVWTFSATSIARAENVVLRTNFWLPAPARPGRLELLAEELDKRTNGQVKMAIAYSSARPTTLPEDLASGKYDVGYSCPAYYEHKLPLASVLNLPMFLPTDPVAADYLLGDVYDHPKVLAELNKQGFRMMFPSPFPPYRVMGTKRIAKVSDFKGAKVRATRQMGQVLEEYGATTVAVPATAAFSGLQKGDIDVVALPYARTFIEFKVYEASKYYTPDIALGTLPCFTAISVQAWNKISKKNRAIIKDIRSKFLDEVEADTAEDNKAAEAIFKERGIEFVSFPKTERARLLAKSAKYWNLWVEAREKAGLPGREIFEFATNKKKEYEKR